MELLGVVGHVEPHFFLFEDNVSVDARKVQSLRQTYHRLKIILDTPDGTTK